MIPSVGGSYFSILDLAFGRCKTGLREEVVVWNVLRKSFSALGNSILPAVVGEACLLEAASESVWDDDSWAAGSTLFALSSLSLYISRSSFLVFGFISSKPLVDDRKVVNYLSWISFIRSRSLKTDLVRPVPGEVSTGVIPMHPYKLYQTRWYLQLDPRYCLLLFWCYSFSQSLAWKSMSVSLELQSQVGVLCHQQLQDSLTSCW